MKGKFFSQCCSKHSRRSEPAGFSAAVRLARRLVRLSFSEGESLGVGRDILLYFLQYRRSVIDPPGRKPAEPDSIGFFKRGNRISTSIIFLSAILLFFCISPCLASSETNALSPADALWKEAETALNSGKHIEAASAFGRFFFQHQNHPRRNEAFFYQGLCEMRAGRTRRAVEHWNRLLDMERTLPERTNASLLALEQLAMIHFGAGDARQLRNALTLLLKNFPDNPVTVKVCAGIAGTRFRSGDYKEAAELYSAVEKHLSTGDLRNLATARAMSNIASLTADQIISTAAMNLEQGSVDAAIALYEAFLGRHPGSPMQWEAKNRLGWSYYIKATENNSDMDLFRRAERLWQEVVKKGPRDEWQARSRWNLIVLNAGPYANTSRARTLCDEQFREFKDSWRGRQAKLTLAWLYLVEEQWQDAHSHFRELADVYNEHDNPRIKEYIERCERGMGRR